MARSKKPSRAKKSPPRKKKGKKANSQDRTFALFTAFLCLLLFVAIRPPTIQGPLNHESPEAFFQELAPAVQKEVRGTGLFPSVVLAQAALESDYGRSVLARDYHNYFGIKASGQEAQVQLPTTEYIDGQWLSPEEPFRTYLSSNASVKDYVKLLTGFDRYLIVLESATPEEAAYALQAAGYATDPSYAAKLVQMIQEYDLKQFD